MTSAVPINSGPIPYPEEADRKIRQFAKIVFYDPAIEALDQVKQILGSADKVEAIARQWADCQAMNSSRMEIQDAKDNLAGYWQGPAFNQFNSYAGSIVGILDADQGIISSIATTLGSCVQTVYNTYGTALRFIGQCAGDLASLGGYAVLAGITAEIPGVDLVSVGALLTKIVDTLSNFVKNVGGLLADAAVQIGSYKSNGISLAAKGNDFRVPESSPAQIEHAGEWHVIPNR